MLATTDFGFMLDAVPGDRSNILPLALSWARRGVPVLFVVGGINTPYDMRPRGSGRRTIRTPRPSAGQNHAAACTPRRPTRKPFELLTTATSRSTLTRMTSPASRISPWP